MKKTRKILIQDKIFSLVDLKKVAVAFEKQHQLAQKSEHPNRTLYSIGFSDGTSIDSDSMNVLDEDILRGPGRPTNIRFSFCNYKLGRDLSFTLRHGVSHYCGDNYAEVSGSEESWINENFIVLKDAIDTTRPQDFWFRKHRTLGLHIIALGFGSLFQLLVQIVIFAFFDYIQLESILKPLPADSPLRSVLSKSSPILYLLLWIFRWTMGMTWAFEIRAWLFRLWPDIEFDFGSEHLKIEKRQRARLIAIITLVVIPMITCFVYDFFIFFS